MHWILPVSGHRLSGRQRQWLVCTIVALLIAGVATALRAEDLCEGLFTGTERVAVPAVAKPPFMKYYREPAFGTRVIRITNAKQGEVLKPAYSTMQAWNSDESMLLLYRGGQNSGHLLLDGKTYQPVRELDIVPSDIEEVFWSHTDPDTLYYISKRSSDYGAFLKYSVEANKSTVLKTFSDICGSKGLPTNGNDPQMQSHDDRLFGFRCQTGEDSYLMFTYNLDTGEVVSAPLDEESGWEPWTAPIPGPSGDRLWLQGSVIKPDLEQITLRHDMSKHSEHASIGLTHDGLDAWYQVAFDPSPNDCDDDLWRGVGHLIEHNMQTGKCRPIVNEAGGYPYTSSGTHISALARQRPGWVAMSSMGYGSFEYFSNKRKAPALFSEVYLVNTDPENTVVCRLAHHRSYAKDAKAAEYKPYFGEAHATISPSGTRILFGSDWYDSGSVDAYVIELPAYQATTH